MPTEQGIVETLNRLIETCKDSEEGFRTAADIAQTPDLKQLFDKYARQRGLFASELQTHVQRLGQGPPHSGTVTAILHRGWMTIKSRLAGKNECAVITECVRGEEAALKTYDEIECNGGAAEIDAALRQQHKAIKEAHARLRALEATCVKMANERPT